MDSKIHRETYYYYMDYYCWLFVIKQSRNQVLDNNYMKDGRMKVGNKLKHVNFLMCWGRVVVSPISSLEFAAAKSLHSCPTLCNPRDSSPPSSAVPRTLQVRTLEWVAISFSNAWKWKVKVKSLSRVRLPATPWTAAHQAPPSMGFSRQEYWSGVPLPSP